MSDATRTKLEPTRTTLRTCETCNYCVYIGEGDFICDRKDDPVLVIEDWIELRGACRKWVNR